MSAEAKNEDKKSEDKKSEGKKSLGSKNSKGSKAMSKNGIKVDNMSKDDIKELPTYDYIQVTVQREIQLGLIKMAKSKPSNPLEFLGKYLIEKSKETKNKK